MAYGEALTDPDTENVMHFDTESVGTEPYTAEDPGRQGQVRGASASEIANSGAFILTPAGRRALRLVRSAYQIQHRSWPPLEDAVTQVATTPRPQTTKPVI